MSTDLKESTESQSTLSSLDGEGSHSKASDKNHDLSRSLKLLALSTKPQQVASFGDFTGSLFKPVTKLVEKFRQSNRYPPIGTSIDLAHLNLISLGRELERFIQEKGGADEDEDEDVEGKVEMEEVPRARWCNVYYTAYVTFSETLLSSDTDEEVYEFWEDFVLNASKLV
ncbi:hypothetical protein JCM5350_005602 [Sporobolomyces pararoseus]